MTLIDEKIVPVPCDECGEPSVINKKDAARVQHYFCQRCWDVMQATVNEMDTRTHLIQYRERVSMGACSTVVVSRDQAICRVLEIRDMVVDRDYRAISMACAPNEEDNADLKQFVDNYLSFEPSKYSNKMLAEVLSGPFYRHSVLEEYTVLENDDYEQYMKENG